MRKAVLALAISIVALFVTGCSNSSSVNKEHEYCITFYDQGEIYHTSCAHYGEKIEKPKDPIKDGYEFSHWATHDKSIDGSEVYDFDVPITKSNSVWSHYKELNPTEETSNEIQNVSRYEKIYNEYSGRLKRECPNLSIKECADICLEGGQKMAEYMTNAYGNDGQYETYNSWWMKLWNVYIEEAR